MRYKRWLAVGDNHGDMIDTGALAAVGAFIRDFKPDERIHLGDCWDMRQLRLKAGDDDKWDQHLQDDLDAGCAFARLLKPTVYLMGNHDHRVIRGMESPNPLMRKLCAGLWDEMRDAIGDVKPAMYNKRLQVRRFHDLKLLHGYASGIGAVRKHALCYGRCMIGHLHRCEAVSVERDDGARGYALGGLAKLEMGYNHQQLGTLAQSNGFAYGIVDAAGHVHVAFAEPNVKGEWFYADNWKKVA